MTAALAVVATEVSDAADSPATTKATAARRDVLLMIPVVSTAFSLQLVRPGTARPVPPGDVRCAHPVDRTLTP